ncbi:outer membrane beta-barrel protein [Ornithobacterium rhinotracheale]|uniref:outer membrane beta-barrel protein n=1 Tax=Ornithobacterium rhinotracheale TaxID=28251 RepID=UPI00387352BB
MKKLILFAILFAFFSSSDKLAINGGGYFGLILGSKVAGVQFPNNTIDLGLIAGLSYKLNEKFALDARYNFGLLEVSDGVPAKNRFVTAGVSYLLK